MAALTGAYAVMLALYHREAGGGQGQVVDLSLLAPLMTLLGPGPSTFDQLGVVPGRHGNRSPNNAPRNAYKTKDNRWVAISASATSVATRVMGVVGRPDIAENEWFSSARERVRHADRLDGIVGEWIGAREFDEVIRAFQDAGAAIAPIYDVEQLVGDPHVQATQMLTRVQDEHLGPLLMQNVIFRLSDTPGGIRFTGRGLGRDNMDVYRERLGLTRDQVSELREKGAI